MKMCYFLSVMKKYKQINGWEDGIANLVAKGKKTTEIAEKLRRHKSTISRELRRNKSSMRRGDYRSHLANSKATARKQYSPKRKRLKNDQIEAYVLEKLKSKWSPEIISGRIGKEHPGLKISHEAIYQYIYHKKEAKEEDLTIYLVRKHRKRLKKRSGRKPRETLIPNRILIDERPDYINKRKEFGHWESDTAVSKASKYAINALVERKTRYLILDKLSRKQADKVKTCLINSLGRYPEQMRLSITYDNGSENVRHELINQALGTKSYFCNPYHSWEKGSVENAIGLLRRYLPKGTDFAKISDFELKMIQDMINNRPKKCLNFRTPKEALMECVALDG